MGHFWTIVDVYLSICCICSVYAIKEACKWDRSGELGLDLQSLDDGASYSAHLPNISDSDGCQMACCLREDCQLAMLGTPADGTTECFLVNCLKDGKDVCILRPSSQFKVFRKMQVSPAQLSEGHTRDGTCTGPQLVGPCKAALPRFYYDVTSGTCKSFIYGGCQGNSNNFGSQEECDSTCRGVTATDLETPAQVSFLQKTSEDLDERCHAAPEAGPCRASLRHHFYNSSAGSCQTFIYGGCRGNKNNYASAEMCQATCNTKVLPGPRKSTVTVHKDPADYCLMPSDSGRCRAAFSMFSYDSNTRSCRLFIFGGCGGNSNRFTSEEECMNTCSGQEGHFQKHGPARDRWTPGFFLVATVAVISALILVGLISISVRKFRMSHLSSQGDKEGLLTEEELLEGPPSHLDTE